MKIPGLKIIDIYIIKKFLGTYFFAIALIVSISIVFDLSEKVDNFIENEAPLKGVFLYYIYFIPWLANLLSSLFTFIAVIFFTSKLAYNSEIIAILSNGVSFRRILLPYFIAATLIAVFSFGLMGYVIPYSNEHKISFELSYIKGKSPQVQRNIHMQVDTGKYVSMRSYDPRKEQGHKFSLEKYKDGKLTSKLMADKIKWDSTANNWIVEDYFIRNLNPKGDDELTDGQETDTSLTVTPLDFEQREDYVETMDMKELNNFIERRKMQGAENLEVYLLEKHRRFSYPFSTFILTLIGVFLSSRKVRGGMGMQIGIGITLSFAYILFMRFARMYALTGAIDPYIAVWIPNFIFAFIALTLYRFAPR
ncbi:MAG: LptF/LptG family permease [Bacteroidota bacterium]